MRVLVMGDVLREWDREGCGSRWGVLGEFRQADRQGDLVSLFAPSAAVHRFNILQLQNSATKSCQERGRKNNIPVANNSCVEFSI